ncbi:hypothetical protein Bca4012_037608 [Brassica carinata]
MNVRSICSEEEDRMVGAVQVNIVAGNLPWIHSNDSEYCSLYNVVIVDAFLIVRELVFWCNSNHGEGSMTKGYDSVSASMIVMGLHYIDGCGDPTLA